jgi:hypothetical protein
VVTADRPAQATLVPSAPEATLLALLNQARAEAGVPPLGFDPGLHRLARGWSHSMAAHGRLAHHPDSVGEARAVVPGLRVSAENVGSGSSPEQVHHALLGSAPHRATMLAGHNRVGIGVAHAHGRLWVTYRFATGDPIAPAGHGTPSGRLWLADTRGAVFAFGTGWFGDTSGMRLNQPVVGMAATPSGRGYWLLGRDGGVFSFGDARFFGSTGGMRLNQPVNGMAVTPSGQGYWLVASDGGVFAFGDARFWGSTGATRLNQPIGAMAVTPSGRGYWLVARDGGIFAFGDAVFHGSAVGVLGAPVVSLAPTPTGRGYLVASADGRVAAFGDAVHRGDAAGRALSAPIVRIQATRDGSGYWLIGADGAVHHFGSVGTHPSAPLPTSGITAASTH